MGCYISLSILVCLYDIGLDFVWIALCILEDLCCNLDSVITLFCNLSLFFKSIWCFKYLGLLFYHMSSTIFRFLFIYYSLCVICVFDNLWLGLNCVASSWVSFYIYFIFFYFQNISLIIFHYIDINYFCFSIFINCFLFAVLMCETIRVLIYLSLCCNYSALLELTIYPIQWAWSIKHIDWAIWRRYRVVGIF